MPTPDNSPAPSSINRTGRRSRWRKVERARAMLDKRANDLMESMINAALKGDTSAARWLLEHTATTGSDGAELRPIAPGVDRAVTSLPQADTAPRILIGVSLGSDFARLNSNQANPPLPPANLPQSVSPAQSTRENANVIEGERVLTSQKRRK